MMFFSFELKLDKRIRKANLSIDAFTFAGVHLFMCKLIAYCIFPQSFGPRQKKISIDCGILWSVVNYWPFSPSGTQQISCLEATIMID